MSTNPVDQTAADSATDGAGSGSVGASASSAAPLGAPVQVEKITGSGLVFNNYWGAGFDPTTASGKAFVADVDAAELYFQQTFTNAVTLNMEFSVGTVPAGFSGQNFYSPIKNISFNTLVADLKNNVASADQQAAVNALSKISDPTGGQGFSISNGMAQALGVTTFQDTAIDDNIILDSSASEDWSFNTGSPSNGSDVIGVLEHEMSEGALGRFGGLGIQNAVWGPMDLFRYTASGQLDTTPQDLKPTYFSVDGSSINTTYQFHNEYVPYVTNPVTTPPDKDDFADWENTSGDPFGPGGGGVATTFSTVDNAVMQVLGWTPNSELSASSGVSLSSSTGSAGGSDKISFSVTNNGQGSAGSFTVGVYISKNTTLTTSDTRIGTATINSLGYGQTVRETVDFNLPVNIALGAYHVGVIVDPDAQLIDTNRANNISGTADVTVTKPTFVWQSATSGDWSATGWGTGGAFAVPGAGDVADMSVTGSPYTVSLDNYTTTVTNPGGGTRTVTNFAVDSVILGTSTTLEISPDSFLLETGAFNSGDILIDRTTTIGNGAANAIVTFNADTGPGVVTLNDASNGTLTGDTATTTLDVHGQTIQGGGSITNMNLVVFNDSKIDATGSNYELTLNTGSEIFNNGVIEATGKSGLVIENVTIRQDAFVSGGLVGVINASGSAAHVDLTSVIIQGGQLGASDQGVIQTEDSHSVLDGSTIAGAVDNLGYVVVNSSQALTLKGIIQNSGFIALKDAAVLALDTSSKVVLTSAPGSAGGFVQLSDYPADTIEGVGGAAATLDNVNNTISGSGAFSGLTIVNESGGVINATGANYQLVIDSSDTLQNSGLLEASGGAGLNISNQIFDTNLGGSFAVGDGSQLIMSSDTFIGGVFATAGSGKWVFADSHNVLDGSVTGEAITNQTTLTVQSNSALTLKGVIHNDGVIALQDAAVLALDPTGVTLDGGGKVTLSDYPVDTIEGVGGAAATLTNVDNTISGSGSFSGLTIINKAGGVIDATGATYQLVINNSESLQNFGLIEATGAAGLNLSGQTIDSRSGGVFAVGDGSVIDISSDTFIGGTFAPAGTGKWLVADSHDVLDGSIAGAAITNKATLTVQSNSALTLKGVIHNDGVIALQDAAVLALDPMAGVTLDGGGKVTLSDYPVDTIEGVGGAAATLTNIDNTISGSGTFTGLTIVNEAGGVIDATGANYQLVINNTDTLQNSGLVEATGAAGLNLSGQTIDVKSGGRYVVGDGSQIILSSDTFIGGTFAPVGTGKWVLADPHNVLDGSVTGEAVTNQTTLTVQSNSALTLKGVIHNDGVIALQDAAVLALDPTSGVTLDGGGKVTLSDYPSNTIGGVGGAAATLTNVDNTISGSGSFSGLTIINKAGGVIDATGATYQLVINNSESLQNFGLIEATGAAGLNLSGQTIDSRSGGVFAVGDGSVIDISSDTFIGGTFAPAGTGKWLVADSRDVLDGSIVGAAITNKATLTVQSNSALTLKGVIHNDGVIALQDAAVLALDPMAGVTLDGGGKVTLTDYPSNTIEGVGGAAATLTNVDNTISGSGTFTGLTIVNEAGGVIEATGANYQLVIDISDTLQNSGVLEANGGTLSVDGAVTGGGHIVVTNRGVANFTGALDENATFASGGGTLELAAGDSGTISGFAADDIIDLGSLVYDASASSVSVVAGATPDTYVATFTEGASSASLTFAQATKATAKEFTLGAASNGGTQINFGDGSPDAIPYDFNGDGLSDILFRDNSNGETYLWGMNGTTVAAGAPTGAQVGNNWQIMGVGDFDGDGQVDLLWEYNNTANAADPLNGISYISLQNGAATAASGSGVVEQLSTNWQVAGVGDFTGNGISDILFRYENAANAADPLNGKTYIDMMNGSQINWAATGFTSQQETDPRWNVVGVADFAGSGHADVLWQYDNTANSADPLNGTLYEWQMNGTSVTSAGLLSAQPGSANWTVAGTGDFDGNGTADILFRYEDTANSADPLNGITYIDFMNGTNVTGGSTTSWQIDNSWQVAGVGDYNGDGKADILFQQASAGQTYIWEMNGANVAGGGLTNEQTGLGWSVQNGVHVQG